MRAFLTALLAVIAIASPSVSATTYYVSSTGSDSNAGTSPSAPWQTIKQVNQAQSALRAGDSVLFCQGQRFEQITLTATTAGVSYSSYKCGSSTAMPVITNSRTVSGAWQTYGTNILKYDLSGDSNAINTGLAAVWVNNKRYHTARYPNLLNPDVAYGVDASEFIMASSNSGSQINAAALTQPNNFFVGASIIFRIANWAYQSSTVLSSTQGSLHTADAPQTGSVGGFILQHNGAQDLNFFLDSHGEWAYDKASRTLYVYPVDSATRQGMLSGSISVSIAYGNVDSAMKISTANIAVSNIAFTQSLNGIAATSANGLTITGTNIQSHLGYGITAPNSASGVRISANTVSDIQITCINVVMPNGFVERNVISGCGLYVYGTSQFGNGIAAQGGTVQYNTITGCGYAAVLPAHGAYTYSNVINGAMLTLNDGAAIYTSGSQAQNLVVYQNTISNVVGNWVSWLPWQIASCIFADQGSVGVSFANNICNSAPQCITFFQVTNGIILSNQCNAPGMYIREGTGNTLMANVVLTNGTSSTLQNPLIRMLADSPTLANGVFTAYYNSYCSSTGGATYLFQRQTSVGTIRYNDFQGWKNVEVANGNPYFEISSSYTQDCSRATSYFGPITGAVSAHAGAAVPPTAEEIRSLVQKKIAELPPIPNKKEVDVAAIVAPVVIGSVLIIIAVIATAVVMVRRERQKALEKTSVLGEPLNSIALRPIVYTMSPMAPITASTTSLSSSPSHSVEIHTV